MYLMTVKNIIHESFDSENVSVIVDEEAKSGTDELKDRVTAKVRERTGITTGNLPERVRTWIHQLCLPYTAKTKKKSIHWNPCSTN